MIASRFPITIHGSRIASSSEQMTQIAEAVPVAPPPSPVIARRPIVHWADLIRVLAIYLVVVIHTSGQVTNVWGKVPVAQWLMADIYGGIARIGVPLFFMLSGFLLLPRSESLCDFYSKRMLKIAIPFVIWSAIYISIDCAGKPGVCTRDYLMQYVLLRKTFFHLWFLYSLLGIYFIMPLLRLMIRPGMSTTVLWYLLVLWVIFQPVRTLMDQFLHWDININAPLATGFLPYFILGYLLGEIELTRKRLIVAGIAFAAGSLITIVGTLLLTQQYGQFQGYFYDYMTVGVIPATAGGFLLLRRLSDTGFLATDRFHRFMRYVSGSTFGVYLVHVLVIWTLERLGITTLMGFALWSVPLVATTVFVIAFFIARLLQKIPVVNYIVPG
jgi:surface polysaccharide O-acyltransferase-like enzyme